MLKRPKNTDTMDDVLEMEKEYKESKNLEPAAKVVTTSKKEKSSLFAKQRNLDKRLINKESVNVSIFSNDVVERKYNSPVDEIEKMEVEPLDYGFPKVVNIDCKESTVKSKESIFARSLKKATEVSENMESIEYTKQMVDAENLDLLNSMTSTDIEREQDELLKTMDPALIKFLKEKKKTRNECKIKEESNQNGAESSYFKDLPTNHILEDANAFNYVNMDVLEPEKLEWIRNIKEIQSVSKDKKYEARFDFKGLLLPYTFDDADPEKANRQYYCHDDECFRPGYTLQELFRLGRSDVLQQRVSALSAIAGILNTFTQGFYDGIIDLPISKIFFVLRIGLDENTPAIIEACIKGLDYLFYNEADEAMLDMIFETNSGVQQPLIRNKSADHSTIESSFENLTLNDRVFETKVQDDNENITDFHLAEIDIVECLERTNIIERIAYIMIVGESNQMTNISCLKVLIRIARTSEKFAAKIVGKTNLMKYLKEKMLCLERPKESELIVKLFRIIAAYNSNFDKSTLIPDILAFISSQNDLNASFLRLQIECFRFLRCYIKISQNEEVLSTIMFPLRFLLEWHLQNLDFQLNNHFICRVHASCLLYLIQCSNVNVIYPLFGETFKMCCKKWYQRASIANITDFSQKILLACLLDVMGSFIKVIPEFFYDFIDDYLIKFLSSKQYKRIVETLQSASLLLNDFQDRRFSHKPLINFGSIVRNSDTPRLIYSQDYSAYYLQSLLYFLSLFKSNENDMNLKFFDKMRDATFKDDGIERYLNGFSKLNKASPLSSNWFAQIEIKLVYNLIKFKDYHKIEIYGAAYNLLQNLSTDKYLLVLDIFENVIFNQEFSTDNDLSRDELERMKYIYNGLVMSKIKEQKLTTYTNEGWNEMLLNDTWIYELLFVFLINLDNIESKQMIETDLKEEEIIMTTLKFKKYLNSKEIAVSSVDENLMFLMLIYFGKELSFLNSTVKDVIRDELSLLKGKSFDFNTKLRNGKDFESLYKLFLETFQAQSYADDVFGVFVMIPLMQSYDVKWRNIVWSEYAMILPFITCQEQDLLYSVDKYLFPVETDQMLLKSYKNNLKYLRKDTLPWKIALHHLNHSTL